MTQKPSRGRLRQKNVKPGIRKLPAELPQNAAIEPEPNDVQRIVHQIRPSKDFHQRPAVVTEGSQFVKIVDAQPRAENRQSY
jgi:hypothetical protein